MTFLVVSPVVEIQLQFIVAIESAIRIRLKEST
jgi:hypothetical protein